MKIAYVFATSGHTASDKLGKMILPQVEDDRHGAEVVGMSFFDDNTYLLRAGDPMGKRLAAIAGRRGILLMLCDRCALEQGLAVGGRPRRPGRLLPGALRRAGRKSAGPDHHAQTRTRGDN